MKLTTLLAIVLMASCVVYAGPHFTVEQNPLEPEAFVEVGWDFEANRIDFTNFSIDGDFFVINDNLWLYPTPWIGGFELGFYWEDEDRTRDLAEVNFEMSVEVTPIPWPDYVELDVWSTSLGVIGRPSEVVTVYAEIGLEYEVTNPPGPTGWIGVWNFEPLIGIRCNW